MDVIISSPQLNKSNALILVCLLSPHGMRRNWENVVYFLSVTPSTKSTKFGSRYLVEGLSERAEIWHDDGHCCVAGLKEFLVHFSPEHNFSTADISHTFRLNATKIGSVRGLANRNLFPDLCELWYGEPVKPCGDMHQSFIYARVKWFFDNFAMFADSLSVLSIHYVARGLRGYNIIAGSFLWPPCVADADIIFCPVISISLSSSFFFFFFPRLISAVGHWMSIILPHMVWP